MDLDKEEQVNDLTDEDALDIMTDALTCLLQDTEGVCVEYQGEKYVVARLDKEVYIINSNQFDSLGEYSHGSLIWVHKEGDQVQ